jgi:hypothetical protein
MINEDSEAELHHFNHTGITDLEGLSLSKSSTNEKGDKNVLVIYTGILVSGNLRYLGGTLGMKKIGTRFT